MRLFTTITLLSAFLLIWSGPFKSTGQSHHLVVPEIIESKNQNFKRTFQDPQCAHVAWALLTGEKSGISAKSKNDFEDLQLNFLFSPSGMHLTALLSLILILPRKLKHKKTLYFLPWPGTYVHHKIGALRIFSPTVFSEEKIFPTKRECYFWFNFIWSYTQ